MAAHRSRRLQKEIQELVRDPHSGIKITSPQGSTEITDFTHFKGHFRGPPDTPYEGGKYEVDIRITPEYPFKPPEMRFITKIWHPNVSSQTGAICLDTLSTAWSPVLNLKSALISLQSLLSSPEPKDPQDAEVASMLLHRPEEFAQVARDWAIRYASAPKPPPGSADASGSADRMGRHESDASAPVDEQERRREEEIRRRQAYKGYNENMVDKFTGMGFQVEQVVSAFEAAGVVKFDGNEYELDDGQNGDIVAHLLSET